MAATTIEVIMPQMGESIAEATISVWRKKVGDLVQEGEALLDISTAKIESEIPAPAGGIIAALLFPEGETVPIDTIIALIAPEGTDLSKFDPNATRQAMAPAVPIVADDKPKHHTPSSGNGSDAPREDFSQTEREELIRHRSTPLVRNIAKDLDIDLQEVKGTGIHGRVTKRDLESFVADQKKSDAAQGTVAFPRNEQKFTPSRNRPGSMKFDTVVGPFSEELPITPEISPVSNMRRVIAETLTRSAQTIPHAYTCHEVDFTQLERMRLRYKPIFEAQFSTRLTPLVFLVAAVADALLKFPSINASWAGDRIVKHKVVNIGIAVALRDGLVVPVLKNVESMSLAGIARGIVELGHRARLGQLKPSDMEGGTFSITSPGQLGATFAIPIILPPQGGIVHLGAIQKVPCVVTGQDGEDAISIRQRAMMTLGIDHRLIDGWEADQFMVTIKERIQRADFGLPA